MSSGIRSVEDLIVWRKAMNLVVLIYEITRVFPRDELYCLVTQMRRCAISIPSNIAEGRRRGSKEFRRFLRIAFGSASELETQIEITKRLGYGNKNQLEEAFGLLEEVLKMLNTMTNEND